MQQRYISLQQMNESSKTRQWSIGSVYRSNQFVFAATCNVNCKANRTREDVVTGTLSPWNCPPWKCFVVIAFKLQKIVTLRFEVEWATILMIPRPRISVLITSKAAEMWNKRFFAKKILLTPISAEKYEIISILFVSYLRTYATTVRLPT